MLLCVPVVDANLMLENLPFIERQKDEIYNRDPDRDELEVFRSCLKGRCSELCIAIAVRGTLNPKWHNSRDPDSFAWDIEFQFGDDYYTTTKYIECKFLRSKTDINLFEFNYTKEGRVFGVRGLDLSTFYKHGQTMTDYLVLAYGEYNEEESTFTAWPKYIIKSEKFFDDIYISQVDGFKHTANILLMIEHGHAIKIQ